MTAVGSPWFVQHSVVVAGVNRGIHCYENMYIQTLLKMVLGSMCKVGDFYMPAKGGCVQVVEYDAKKKKKIYIYIYIYILYILYICIYIYIQCGNSDQERKFN